ncbi:DNA-directed RNA polymerase subunit beta [Bacillus tianshenii]|uniref:DNA-directed RNA polymerase subunit beta n=1 Tax=Sutcliffiella tianshenii TaxID=1463404 RepID=UPI001CD5F67E|nr:DNA-directed RNA polymerase subunit beta [Bacillus tianshenii]MCA1320238.1 DNA-directed RNA polymerase subunit beta [Bacillus tianshenii]
MEQNEARQESLTREELRKAQKHKAKQEREEAATSEEKPKRLKWRTRLIPIWLRLIIILGIMLVAAVAGAMFGYGVLGGGNPIDVLDKSTWQHIIDLVNKE